MLTYSCPVNMEENPIECKEDLMEFLKELPGLQCAVVSKELHENGKSHFHAAIQFEDKFRTRNLKVFDFKGVHPNIGTTGNFTKMVNYVTKEGDYISHNLDVAALLKKTKDDKPMGKKDKLAESYSQAFALAEEGNITEAKKLIQRVDPIRWATDRVRITATLSSMADSAIAEKHKREIKTTRWVTPLATLDVRQKEPEEDWIRVNVLVGKSGIGKTEFAQFLLKQAGCKAIVVCRDVEQLKDIDFYDGVVFDEFDGYAPEKAAGKRWTREQMINLVDCNVRGALPARYGNVTLATHVLRIITTNDINRALDVRISEEDPEMTRLSEPIRRRIRVHELGDEKLYE